MNTHEVMILTTKFYKKNEEPKYVCLDIYIYTMTLINEIIDNYIMAEDKCDWWWGCWKWCRKHVNLYFHGHEYGHWAMPPFSVISLVIIYTTWRNWPLKEQVSTQRSFEPVQLICTERYITFYTIYYIRVYLHLFEKKYINFQILYYTC